jgi:hypothetical protein
MNLLNEIFREIRKKCFAEIDGVEYSSVPKYAQIDWLSNKILINPNSFEEFEKKGMSRRK